MTLIETVVSVTILVAAITGPMVLASQSLKASRDARAELVATHLAEEGIEVVSSIRENNSADDVSATRSNWMIQGGQNMFSLCSSGDGCVIDITDHTGGVWGLSTLIQCPAGDCTTASLSNVYYYAPNGLYRQAANPLTAPWSVSPYKRSVKIVGVDNGVNSVRQARVTSTVTYAGYNGNIHTITLHEDFYNWFPKLN